MGTNDEGMVVKVERGENTARTISTTLFHYTNKG